MRPILRPRACFRNRRDAVTIAIIAGTPIPIRDKPPDSGIVVFSGVVGTDLSMEIAGLARHPVSYIAQEQDQWCWAACFEMIEGYLGLGRISQLEMATRVFGNGACANPKSSSCNRAAIPSQVIHLVGMSCTPVSHALSAAELGENLGYGPVEVEFQQSTIRGVRSHVALISAMNANGTVSFLDPWPDFGPSFPTLIQLQAKYHWGPWIRSYVQFAAS